MGNGATLSPPPRPLSTLPWRKNLFNVRCLVPGCEPGPERAGEPSVGQRPTGRRVSPRPNPERVASAAVGALGVRPLQGRPSPWGPGPWALPTAKLCIRFADGGSRSAERECNNYYAPRQQNQRNSHPQSPMSGVLRLYAHPRLQVSRSSLSFLEKAEAPGRLSSVILIGVTALRKWLRRDLRLLAGPLPLLHFMHAIGEA
jgi:hypothetical protein